MANVVVSALATWNGKALKKGKQDISSFDKSVKALGRTFGVTFSAAALVNFSKKAVNAFAADEKAAKALEVQLKNTGNEFAGPAVEYYIANLQKISGILDDELRPAFKNLLTVTKSVELSQYALNTALEVSAGTGASVIEVSNAIAKGFAGQTRALKTLVPGLDEAALKTGDMETILKQLNKLFAGQSAARLSTYAGKMDLLTVASSNATEIIGEGLVDALTELSKDKSISSLATSMENLATNTSAAITEIAKVISKFTELTGNPSFKAGMLALALLTKNPKIVVGVMSYIGASGALGLATQDYGLGNQGGTPFGQASSATELAKDQERKRLEALAKLRAKENALIKEKNALEDLKKKYDTERIGLMLALNQATDEETKLRIAEKLAILDGNAAKAQEYLAAENAYDWRLQEIESLKELTAAQYKAASSMTTLADWLSYRAGERGDNLSNVPSGGGGGGGGGGGIPMSIPFAMGANQRGEYAPVTVNVAGSLLTEQDLTNTINETLLRINKMGRGTTPAGGLSGGT
jgi:hypothetical protein